MRRHRTFEALCALLRAGLLDDGPVEPRPRAGSALLIEVSSHHMVTPVLSWCLKDNAAVSDDARDYLESVLVLNGLRNRRMMEELDRAVAALNAIGIEPILLKGAAHLIEGLYPGPQLRILSDLDILIPESKSGEAVAKLQDIGFVSTAFALVNHHHLAPIKNPRSGVHIELHTRVVRANTDAIVPTDWFCAATLPVSFRGLKVRVPDATRSIAHNIVHSQIDASGFLPHRTQLRYLLDFALMRKRHGDAIDWSELDDRFSAAGYGQVLPTYLTFVEKYLGQPTRPFSHAPSALALRRFQVNVERSERRLRARHRIERLRLARQNQKLIQDKERLTQSKVRLAQEKLRLVQKIAALRQARDQLLKQNATLRSQRSIFIALAAWSHCHAPRVASLLNSCRSKLLTMIHAGER